MPKSADVSTRREVKTPEWARNACKMVATTTCAVLKRPWWIGCAKCVTNVLKAFVYDVPGLNGVLNNGLKLVCACMTVYLLLDGVLKAYPDLRQVCLPPCGFSESGVMEGDGGAVQWSDKSFQEVLHYLCVMTRVTGQCRVQQDGDGEVAGVPGKKQSAVGGNQSAAGAGRMVDGEMLGIADCRCKVVKEGSVVAYDDKPYYFDGAKRWGYVMKLLFANGEFVHLGKGIKGCFSKDKQSLAFYDAAIEAEGKGRMGTGCYKMKAYF